MKSLLQFFLEIGKLSKVERKGITFYCVENPDSATDHSFRMAMMVWAFHHGKKINIEKALKIALVHDVCKIYTGDITPYDGLLPKDKKDRDEFVKRWRRLLKEDKKRIHSAKTEKERRAILKLTAKLPKKLKKEIETLWEDYTYLKSPESRFVHQIDVIENLIEAFECWEKDKKFPTTPWWQHIDEIIDDPLLLEFLKEIEKEELKGK